MRRKKTEDQAAPARADGRITPTDVQQVEFRLAFRGYKEHDVDAFLDRITEDLSGYIEENERLRSGGGLPAAPVAAAAPVGEEARAEAEAIVARAREEAAAIVRRAEQEATTVRATASGDPRAAIAPFLSREREFLESLGGLVQGHAEEIKQMVLADRARTEATRAASPEGSEPTATEAAAVAAEGASAAEIRQRLGEPEPAPAPDPEPVIIESATEPVFAPEGPKPGDERERSLRELFWGDD
jgi:DivIVA domain-containing protein